MPAVRSFPRIFTPSGDSFRLTRKNNAINSLPLGSRVKIERARPVCLGERIFCALDTLYFFFFFCLHEEHDRFVVYGAGNFMKFRPDRDFGLLGKEASMKLRPSST